MNKKGIRIATCAIIGTMVLSGYHTTLEAKLNRSSEVPAAGVAVVLDDGITIQDLQVEVIQNIAYLESVSGIQPNIVIASEKVALSEGTDLEQSTVLDDGQLFSQETNKDNIEKNCEVSVQEETDNIVSTEQVEIKESDLVAETTCEAESSHVEENSEVTESSQVAESSQVKETSQSEEDTKSEENSIEEVVVNINDEEVCTESETEIEIRTSAGFASTGSYDEEVIVEDETEEVETEEATESETEVQDFSNLVIAQVNDYVNVRSIPSQDGEIVGKLYDKSVGEYIEEKDGWYKIKSGNCTGYVKAEYCVTGEEANQLAKEVGTTYATVNTTTLKVREESNTESVVLGLVPLGEELVVVEELDGWVKISIEEGDGYVSKEFVNLRTDFVHAESKEEEEERLAKEAREREEARRAAEAARAEAEAARNAAENAETVQITSEPVANTQTVTQIAQNTIANSQGNEMGKAVVDYAVQFVGNPYVWGGTSLTNGADCSGFVMSVYSNFGVGLPHSSSALRSRGTDVGGIQNAQPGDIVCYSGHVGLYIGNGQIVHASSARTGIKISNANYKKILTVRRIF